MLHFCALKQSPRREPGITLLPQRISRAEPPTEVG